MNRSNLRLWRVIGTGRSGGAVTFRLRAGTHDEALERARSFGLAQCTSCVLVEEARA